MVVGLVVVGVQFQEAPVAGGGFVIPLREPVGVRQPQDRGLVFGIERQGFPVGADRPVPVVPLDVEVAEDQVRFQDAGILGEDALHLGHGVLDPVLGGVGTGLLQQVVEDDLVLGVGEFLTFLHPDARGATQVAERGELGPRLLVQGLGGLFVGSFLFELGHQLVEPRLELANLSRPLGGEIPCFARIIEDLEEFRTRRRDEVEQAVAEGAERSPAVVVPGVEALRVRPESQVGRRSVRERNEARPLHVAGDRHAHHVEDGRHQVDPAHLGGDPQSAADLAVWRPEQEGHLHRGVVDEKAVRPLAVPAEALPVVPDQDEQRVVRERVLVQPVEQPPDQGIGEQHLRVIGGFGVAADPGRPRFRRLVGPVRVIEVDPGEEPFLLHPVHPVERRLEDLVPGALHAVEADPLELAEVEVVEVAVESLVEPPAGVDDEGGDERAGPVPRRAQRLGERFGVLPHVVAAVVPYSIEHRVGPGEHGGVGGQGERHGGGRLLEEDSLGRYPAEGGRLDPVVAVLGQVTRRQGVQRHHHDVQGPDGIGPAG